MTAGTTTLETIRAFLAASGDFQLAEIGLHPGIKPEVATEAADAWYDPLTPLRPHELQMLVSARLEELFRVNGCCWAGLAGMICAGDFMASPLDQRSNGLTRLCERLAITLWLILAVVIAGKTLQNPKNHSTYPLFYEASVAWWNGVYVYDRNVFADDYRYGPSFAMVLGAIACLPLGIRATVWALMNVGIALWATMSLARRVLPGMQSPLSRNLLLAVSVFPSADCLYSGQTNLLVFSLVAFAAIAILDERWWLAAVLLAIPIHIKVWPLAGALLLTACWPRRLAWRLPIALAAVAALPLLAKPPAWVCEQYVEWYRLLSAPRRSVIPTATHGRFGN